MPDSKAFFERHKDKVLLLAVAAIILAIIFSIQSGKPQLQKAQQQDPQAQNPQQQNPLGQAAGAAQKAGLQKAPELAGIKGYINAPEGFNLASRKGKVVLVDFWTYTCINCIRTLPYLKSWHEKYEGKGLVIIGVHTPEFEFEKDFGNVEAAVEKYGLRYPVVLDNDYATWRAYKNQYWPHKYLIDADGYIRYDHIGEGGYGETEAKIVELLQEKDAKVQMDKGKPIVQPTEFSKIGTPELYLGYDFARAPFGNAEGFQPGKTFEYRLPGAFAPNLVYLEGQWENNEDSVKLVSGKGKVVLLFNAKNVNIVAGNMDAGGSKVLASIDGAPINAGNKGTDAPAGGNFTVNVHGQKLYNVVSLQEYALKRLELDVNGAGFELYTFTFG